MGFVGIVVGFAGGYIIGTVVLMILLSAGLKVRVVEDPSLKVWMGAFNFTVAVFGASLGCTIMAAP